MKFFNKTIIHFLLIALAVTGLYLQTTDFSFVLDDKIVISENSYVKKGFEGIKEIFGNDTMSGYLGKENNLLQGGRYRPLSLVVFAVGYHFFELNPFYYHLLNILFYFACCIVLYFTLIRLFHFSADDKEKFKPFLFLATLLFAIHPIHTEAVANIKGLDEILAFLFGTATLWLTLIYFDSNKKIYLISAFVLFILGLLAKESALPLMLAIPVALYFFRETSLKMVFRFFILFLIPTAVYLLIRYNALGFILNNKVKITGIMNDPYIGATFSQKTGTILFTLMLYLKLLFFPHPLTHDYYPYHIQLINWYHPLALLALAVIALLIVIAIRGIKKRDPLAYIIFFFFITISIVSNILINVGAFMNERFLFIPSFAFSVLVVYAFVKLGQRKSLKLALMGISTVLVSGFTYKSLDRIPDWKNEITLNSAAVNVSKNSARANCFYAVSLYNQVLNEKDSEIKMGKIAEAKKYVNRSLKIYPEYTDALRMKAGFAAEDYKIDKDADKLLNVFRDIQNVKRLAYLDEFTDWLAPRSDKTKLVNYYFDVGYNINAVKKHNFNLATYYLQKGYKLNPNDAKILFGSCVVQFLTGKYDKAVEYGNAYLQKYGENAQIYYYIGNAQIKNGHQQEGLKNLDKAFQLDPKLKNQKLN